MYILIYNRAGPFHLLLPQVLAHRWLLAKGRHLLVHLFVSFVLFVFVFAVKSLLVCYCACSLSRNIFPFEEIIYKNQEIKTSQKIVLQKCSFYEKRFVLEEHASPQYQCWSVLQKSFIKQYEEIRKLTTVQGEDYTTGCVLQYEYIKNHYRLIAVDLSRKKELVQIQKQFNKQNLLNIEKKKIDNASGNVSDAGNDQSICLS